MRGRGRKNYGYNKNNYYNNKNYNNNYYYEGNNNNYYNNKHYNNNYDYYEGGNYKENQYDNNYNNNYNNGYNNNYRNDNQYYNKNNYHHNNKNNYQKKTMIIKTKIEIKKKKDFINYNDSNKKNKDKKEDDEIKILKDSIKTNEIKFLKDLSHIYKLEPTEKLFKDLFKKETLENKLKEIFNMGEYSPDKLYTSLFKLFSKEIEDLQKMNNKRQNEEEKNVADIRNIYDDIYDAIILSIQKDYIKRNESKEIKNSAIEEFNELVNKVPDCLFYILDKFINIYNIENELKENFTNFKNFDEFSKKYKINPILYIIKTFKLQDKFSFKIVCENISNLKEVIKNLYGTYNVNKAMLNELNEYINSHIEKNSVELIIINEIFIINENNPEFDKDIKKYIYDNLLYFDKNNFEENYLKKYYTFLINNKIESFHTEYNILSLDNIYCLINDYSLYETALYLMGNLEKEKLDKIDNKLLDKIITNFRSDQKKEIKEFLDLFPNKIGSIITYFRNKDQLKELLAILKYAKKADKLSDEIANEIDKDKYYGILNNKFKRNYQEKHQIYSIIEIVTKSKKYFNIFFPILEKIIRKSNDANDVKLLYTVIDIATKKNYNQNITKKYKYNNEDLIELNDCFGPQTENCLSFKKDEINVVFIDSVDNLKLYGEKYFKNSEFIGFDSEWVDKIKCKEKTETAIVQLSDYDGKNVLILDMVNLQKNNNFINAFKEIFTGKKFIGYDLKDDLLNLPNEIMTHLQEKNELIDIQNLYKISTLESTKSFSEICKEFFGKPLCKYEQCSNWELRPLRQSQLHYAALDAIYCSLLFKKIIEKK